MSFVWITLAVLLLAEPLTWLGRAAPVVDFEGTQVPGVCPEETIKFARDYAAEAVDIFVATQMKCGTTWMQQIVFQVLTRGGDDISEADQQRVLAYCREKLEGRGYPVSRFYPDIA